MQRRRLGLSALLYFVLVLAPPPAIAECDGPFPSFRNVAPSARQIIIGQVVAAADDRADRTDGRTSNFLLRGWSVLEGSRPIEVQIQEVPTQPCAGVIVARPGDEIAIAFGGRDFQPPQVVNAVAWLSGAAPQLIGIETVTLVEVYALVGLDVPTSLPDQVPPAGEERTLWLLALPLIAAAAGAIALLARRNTT